MSSFLRDNVRRLRPSPAPNSWLLIVVRMSLHHIWGLLSFQGPAASSREPEDANVAAGGVVEDVVVAGVAVHEALVDLHRQWVLQRNSSRHHFTPIGSPNLASLGVLQRVLLRVAAAGDAVAREAGLANAEGSFEDEHLRGQGWQNPDALGGAALVAGPGGGVEEAVADLPVHGAQVLAALHAGAEAEWTLFHSLMRWVPMDSRRLERKLALVTCGVAEFKTK